MAIQSFRKDDTERERISGINYINSINIKLYIVSLYLIEEDLFYICNSSTGYIF